MGIRQEKERAVVERDRSEELAKRMTKSLKSRAAEAMSAAAAADAGEDGDLPKAATNGSALGSENGDEVREGDRRNTDL